MPENDAENGCNSIPNVHWTVIRCACDSAALPASCAAHRPIPLDLNPFYFVFSQGVPPSLTS